MIIIIYIYIYIYIKRVEHFQEGAGKNLVVFDNARPNNKHEKKPLNVKKYMIQLLWLLFSMRFFFQNLI